MVKAIPSLLSRRQDAVNLQVVDSDSKPTEEQKKKLSRFANFNVGSQSDDDWYVILRETQGDILAALDAGFIEDASDFARDSLFCEWGYLANLDTNRLEVYKGFNKEEAVGRFSSVTGSGGYQPITLIAEISFDDLDRFSEIIEELLEEDY